MKLNDLALFKKYKYIFGKPHQGIHSIRIFDVALIDYIGTILFAFAFRYFTNIPIEISTIIAFSLGILAHILFGIDTPTNQWLFL